MPQVFVSYSHDNDPHYARVRDLVHRMRSDGLQVILDADLLPAGPSEGWLHWSEAQVRAAGKVLIVCTAHYCARYEGTEVPGIGCGATCEARAIRQILYNAGGLNDSYRVVILTQNDDAHVPLSLQTYHRFKLYNSNEYDALRTWLTGDPVPPLLSTPNPLTTPYEWTIADRLDILQAFEQAITGRSRQRILLVCGSTNNGKTAIMRELCAWSQQLGINYALLDFKGCPSLDEVFDSLRDLGPAILQQSYNAQGTARFHNLITDLQSCPRPLLLIFDSYEQASPEAQKWLESQFLLRLERAAHVVIVIGGQKVPDHDKYTWREIARYLELHPIHDPAHWIDYLNRKWQFRASVEMVEAFTMAARGNPGVLSSLLDSLAVQKKAGA